MLGPSTEKKHHLKWLPDWRNDLKLMRKYSDFTELSCELILCMRYYLFVKSLFSNSDGAICGSILSVCFTGGPCLKD